MRDALSCICKRDLECHESKTISYLCYFCVYIYIYLLGVKTAFVGLVYQNSLALAAMQYGFGEVGAGTIHYLNSS